MFKKQIEKREKEFKKMDIDRKEVLQRKLHEEKLLVQRISIFLLANSILLLGFANLLKSDAWVVLFTIPCIGIIASLFLFPHFRRVKIELDTLNILLGEQKGNTLSEIFRGVSVFLWLAVLFTIIWAVSLSEVICRVG